MFHIEYCHGFVEGYYRAGCCDCLGVWVWRVGSDSCWDVVGGTLLFLLGCLRRIYFRLRFLLTIMEMDRELARGNTFNATSFCSYGAYWITSSIISALGKFETLLDLGKTQSDESMGLYFMVSATHLRHPVSIMII